MNGCLVCRRRLAPTQWKVIEVNGRRRGIHIACASLVATVAAAVPPAVVASADPRRQARIVRTAAAIVRIRARRSNQ